MLKKSTGIDDISSLSWGLVLASAGAWLICFLCLFKSLKMYGKISHFMGLFPYVVFALLAIRGTMLDGAEIGIRYFLEPDLSKLTSIDPWRDAAGWCFIFLILTYLA